MLRMRGEGERKGKGRWWCDDDVSLGGAAGEGSGYVSARGHRVDSARPDQVIATYATMVDSCQLAGHANTRAYGSSLSCSTKQGNPS